MHPNQPSMDCFQYQEFLLEAIYNLDEGKILVQQLSVSFSLSSEVAASFAAATITAAGTGVGLNKIVAKVTVSQHTV